MMRDTTKDLKFMQSPQEWPAWPLLPLKRPDPSRPGFGIETGVMLAEHGVLTTVFLCNLFAISANVVEQDEKIEYKSYEEIIADGWRVD